MNLKSFLDKYDTVIFDMDGVITSEQNYWNSAALTVWEYLKKVYGNEDINPKECMEKVNEIRKKVFCDDKTIAVLKGKGVNSNWDLGYVIVCLSLIHNTTDFEKLFDYAKALDDNILNEYDKLSDETAKAIGKTADYTNRSGKLWWDMCECFQEWFLGDEEFFKLYKKQPATPGKTGLMFREEPIVDKNKLVILLELLSRTKRVCTGTGRPFVEVERPLVQWDVLKYFADNGLCNYNHVVEAEKALGNNALTKPHPYMFLKALYGTDYDDAKIVNGDYDKEKIKSTLIVGDAGADILAAQAMGADFCAVLTGIQGKDAREFFEELKADYILDSVLDFLEEE